MDLNLGGAQYNLNVPVLHNAGSATGVVGQSAGGLTSTLKKADFPDVAQKISQKQLRHIAGRPELAARGGGGYLNSVEDAQA
ncbi:hypothetical protein ACP0G2_26590, partial [Escherichia coli]|uniref:hypothetical protein n=1 Tax=Escherichia coli TaxID=562 RepID=UPI003CF9FF04